MVIGKVGSKGELFPPKEIRTILGLKSGDKVEYRIIHGTLVVERIPSVEELLKKPKKVSISVDEIKENRSSLSQSAFK